MRRLWMGWAATRRFGLCPQSGEGQAMINSRRRKRANRSKRRSCPRVRALCGGAQSRRGLGGALFKFVDGGDHGFLIDFMDFEGLTDGAQESDGEFAAKVLAKFFEAREDV